MLILSENDILNAVDFNDLLKSAENALLLQESGEFFMPDRVHLHHQGNVQLIMPAFANDHFATKLVSVYPGNRKLGKPSLYGTVILQDGHTGEPLALLNGAKLTALRTGAAGALGLAWTSPRNLETIGLVGAGVQGFHQALFACTVRNINKIAVFDPYHKDIQGFIRELSAFLPEVKITEQKNIHELLNQSEAVITSTTSLKPVIPGDVSLINGKHFIGIGSYRPDMREYPDALFKQLSAVIVDTPLAKKESGDLASPLKMGLIREDQVYTLGKLISGKVKIDDTQTNFFKSVGMALFDLEAAEIIYSRAKQKQIGQEVEL